VDAKGTGGKASRVAAARWIPRVAALLLPFLMFFWIAPFLGDETIGHDYAMYPVPHQMELQYSIEHGTWPLHAPGFAGGRPAAALTLGQMYHPISHIAASLPGYWDGHALDLNTLLRLIGLGLAHLALLIALERLRLRTDVAFVLSFVTVYNMRVLDLFRFGASLENYTGHLFLCAAMIAHFVRPTRVAGPLLMIGATCLLVVGGHPQMMYYGLMASGLFALAAPFVLPHLLVRTPDPRATLRFWGVVGGAMAAGIALASAYLVPLYFDFVAETGARVERAYHWSLMNCDTWGGALNSFFQPLNASVTGAFGGSALIAVVLVFPLIALARARAPRGVMVVAALFALLFAVSLGRATPLHRVFWEYVPLASSFRVPGRISMVFPSLILLILLWLMSAGDRRVTVWGRELPVPLQTAAFGAALASHLLYNFALKDLVPLPGFPLPYRFREIPDWVFPAGVWIGAATLALAALHGVRWRARWAIGVLMCLAVVGQTWVVLQYGTWIVDKHPTPTLAVMDGQKEVSLAFRGPPGNMLQSDLVDRKMRDSFLDQRLAVFYRNFIPVSDRDSAYEAMAAEADARTLVVEGAPGKSERVGYDGTEPDEVVLEEASFNRLVFDVNAGAPGFLSMTLLDTGRWRARVDGEEAPVYIANGGEQAVRLGAGRHRVEYRFDSPAARAGMIASAVALALIGVFFSTRAARGKRRLVLAAASAAIPAGLFALWSVSLYGGDDLGTEYSWSSSEMPPADNLAYGRPTRMSSIRSSQSPYRYLASRAVDGDRVTTAFLTRKGKGRPWWQVDLGERRELGSIAIYDGHGRGGKNHLPLRVSVSDDGKKFTLARKVDQRGGARPWRIDLEGVKARFIRLKSGRKRPMGFREVEVYAPAIGAGSEEEH